MNWEKSEDTISLKELMELLGMTDITDETLSELTGNKGDDN